MDDPGVDLSESERRTAAAILAGVERDRARAAAAIEPDPRVLYGVWGTAWLVGFALLYGGQAPGSPVTVSAAVATVSFTLLMVSAMVVTSVHMARRFAGVRGPSSTVGAMYGWAWALAFVAFAAVMTGARRAGADEAVLDVLWSAGSGLVVGILYLVGGALWQDRVQFGLGAWILVASAAGALVGSPAVYLVMSVAGGGGFLLAAAWFALRAEEAGGAP